ncbi:MAG: molybdopterin biosynthesis protein [Deltaproteobacteria bacterium]|nr:molybdopterin biosynthesis protein [Deltaproteobacteria bacterium]MBW2340911.1 molybdopterin biosynthesis protein [Deltaproteobacteria bacterium]
MTKKQPQKIYLKMKDPQEALELFFETFNPEAIQDAEEISVHESCGRITKEPIFAKISSPPYHSAAMDGITVRAEDTYGATERNPKRLKIGQEALWINTGQVIPEGKNAVVMAEKLNQIDEETVEIESSAFPWQNIRKVGEDFVVTELLFPQNHRIRPFDLGTLIGGGILHLKARRRPRVLIIPTGSELVDLSALSDPSSLKQGKIIESNSSVLSSLVEECGAEPIVEKIVEDKSEKVKEALLKAVDSESDVVITIAGSSAGRRDHTAEVIEGTGELLVHGVTIMPGKPTILGRVKGKPVVGIPGYPVSAYIAFDEFVRPYLYRLQGSSTPKKQKITVGASRDIPSKLGVEEFIRVNLGRVGERMVAIPLPRAAGSVTTLSKAEAIIRVPSFSEGIVAGEETEAELLVDLVDIANTIVIIGSHDITVDILSDEIREKDSAIRIASGNVGSLGGLLALKKGTAHVAGAHLLDTATGEYNISYIQKYLKGVPVHVFNLVVRDQGLIIQRGNPKQVRGIGDLTRDDLSFINRQPGSGTRILFDYKLQEMGIDPSQVSGYDNEEYTHMNVAVAVLNGMADVGLGIMAAAKALDLDFVPVLSEQYDLVIPSSFVNDHKIQLLISVARSKEFRKRVEALGGYNPEKSGALWKVI